MLFKTVLIALLHTTFALSPQSKPETSFKFVGESKLLGYFDPLQLTTNPTVDESTVKYLREAELQHGRTAMMSAVIFPLIETTTHTPATDVLSSKVASTQVAWLTIFGMYELARMNAGWVNPFTTGTQFKLEDDYEPGAVFLTGKADFFESDDAERRLNVELNNGRLAMIGMSITILSEMVNNKPLFF